MREQYDAAKESQGHLILTVAPVQRGRDPVRVPVRINSLSATGALLESREAESLPHLLGLAGREAAILLPGEEAAGLGEIPGRISWARPGDAGGRGAVLGFELKEPELEVRKVLEDHMDAFPRDIKDLWDSWDELHRRRPAQVAEQAVYLVGVGAMAAGTTLYLAGPESLRLYGSIMALYGCVMMAAKSLWTMWRTRTVSR